MRAVLTIGISLLLSGCQYAPHARLLATDRPDPVALVGTYHLVDVTLPEPEREAVQRQQPVIELRPDGTFRAAHVPSFDDTTSADTLVSGSGTWRIATVGVVDDGWTRRDVWGVYLDSPVKMAPVNVTNEVPARLLFEIGDPDSGEALIFARAN